MEEEGKREGGGRKNNPQVWNQFIFFLRGFKFEIIFRENIKLLQVCMVEERKKFSIKWKVHQPIFLN